MLFQDDGSNDSNEEGGHQLMIIDVEENIDLPLPNEEANEIESAMELEPTTSLKILFHWVRKWY